MLIDFCLPAKNEEKILPASLDRLLAYSRQAGFNFSWRLVGVINGSDDQSAAIFKAYADRYPKEISFINIKEAGRGGALKKYWSLSPADILVYMDSDLAVSLDDIPSLVSPLISGGCDLAVGSRLSTESELKRSLGREIISRGYVFITHFLLNDNTADYQCGFKAVRREIFLQLQPFLRDDYWFFDTELIVLAKRFGFRVQEIPVDWQQERYSRRMTKVKIIRDSLIFINNLWLFRKRLKSIKRYPHNA